MNVLIGNPAAPKKDRVKGSKLNVKGSARNKTNTIVFSDKLTQAIKTIIKDSSVSLQTAKAVVRRGFGAYSTSHRPGVSRTAWGLARLKQFVRKKEGLSVNKKYIQDDDLL